MGEIETDTRKARITMGKRLELPRLTTLYAQDLKTMFHYQLNLRFARKATLQVRAVCEEMLFIF